MNRRGELERAVSRARIGPAHYALFTQLLRRSGNDTGEIPDDRYAPRLETLADQAKIARSAAYPALAELMRHGWFTRYATNRAKVAGKLTVGSDCDCGGAVPVCQREGCGKPLASRRRDARYCSDRCGKAARRLSGPVSIARTTQPAAASPKSPDMSAVKPGQPVSIARTTRRSAA